MLLRHYILPNFISVKYISTSASRKVSRNVTTYDKGQNTEANLNRPNCFKSKLRYYQLIPGGKTSYSKLRTAESYFTLFLDFVKLYSMTSRHGLKNILKYT